MNRDETVALFLQGREAWNAWAEKMLAGRKALEALYAPAAASGYLGWQCLYSSFQEVER